MVKDSAMSELRESNFMNSVTVIKQLTNEISVFQFKKLNDPRGDLTASLFRDFIPFSPVRFFFIKDIPESTIRGEHAHKKCDEFLIALNGAATVTIDDGTTQASIRLTEGMGINLPAMTWRTQQEFQDGTTLLAFASLPYEASDYIRDHKSFLDIKKTMAT